MSANQIRVPMILALAVASFGHAEAARAVEVSATIAINGNPNEPHILVLNSSPTDVELTELDVTIGDTGFNFDRADGFAITDPAADLSTVLVTPDGFGAGRVRSDNVFYEISGLQGGDAFGFLVDIDRDDVDSVEDYRSVLFNNGAAANARVTATFESGLGRSVVSTTLNDGPQGLTTHITTLRGQLIDADCGGELQVIDVSVPAKQRLKNNLIDGDLSTAWNVADDTTFTLTLNASREVKCIDFAPRSSRAYDVDVFVNDVFATSFTTASEAEPSLQRFALPSGVIGDTVRFVIQNYRWLKVHEVVVSGD